MGVSDAASSTVSGEALPSIVIGAPLQEGQDEGDAPQATLPDRSVGTGHSSGLRQRAFKGVKRSPTPARS